MPSINPGLKTRHSAQALMCKPTFGTLCPEYTAQPGARDRIPLQCQTFPASKCDYWKRMERERALHAHSAKLGRSQEGQYKANPASKSGRNWGERLVCLFVGCLLDPQIKTSRVGLSLISTHFLGTCSCDVSRSIGRASGDNGPQQQQQQRKQQQRQQQQQQRQQRQQHHQPFPLPGHMSIRSCVCGRPWSRKPVLSFTEPRREWVNTRGHVAVVAAAVAVAVTVSVVAVAVVVAVAACSCSCCYLRRSRQVIRGKSEFFFFFLLVVH